MDKEVKQIFLQKYKSNNQKASKKTLNKYPSITQMASNKKKHKYCCKVMRKSEFCVLSVGTQRGATAVGTFGGASKIQNYHMIQLPTTS